MNDSEQTIKSGTSLLSRRLAIFHWRWRAGLFVAGLCVAMAAIAITLGLAGALDFYESFSDQARLVTFWFITGVGVVGLLVALWRVVGFGRRDAAAAADAAMGSTRRETLSAMELAKAGGSSAGLGHWLAGRSIESAAAALGNVPLRKALPVQRIWRSARVVVLLGLIWGILMLVVPGPSSLVLRRILNPRADIPPYTHLKFTLGPDPAEVVYGGELILHAAIDGKPRDHVRVITRNPESGVVGTSSAYAEGNGKFSTKLEKVAYPVEVAFATGRARSHWLSVKVLMQPKVEEIVIEVHPPKYTGQPSREFVLGSEELSALAGSRMVARVRSNRPLAAGSLEIVEYKDQPGRVLEAESAAEHTVTYEWEAIKSGRLAFVVRDLLGTVSDPVQLDQKVLVDERPEVAIQEPGGEVVATPDSEVPFRASVEDDYGLSRIALVRKLQSFRERSQTAAEGAGASEHEFESILPLSKLGVKPGQTIEIAVEARDTNPNLMGATISEPSRIHIISHDQYAERVRAETTLEDFAARYEAIQAAIQKSRKGLEQMSDAVRKKDGKAAEDARKRALDAHEKAAELLSQIARDFPAFASDERLSNSAKDVAVRMGSNIQALKDLEGADTGKMFNMLPLLEDRLGESELVLKQDLETGSRVVAAGRVFQQAAKFNEVITAQRQLVKRLNNVVEQIRRGQTSAGQVVENLGLEQREIEASLRSVMTGMHEALGALPPEFALLRKEGYDFLWLLNDANPEEPMGQAAKAAETSDSRTASQHAAEALRRLEVLLRNPNQICSMCRGEKPGWSSMPDIKQMLEQLMASLISKPGGPGEGGEGGEGGGISGSSESGFSVQGKMLRVPIYGPARMRFSKPGSPGLAEGRGGKGGGGTAAADVGAAETPSLTPEKTGGEAIALEIVPEKYREAVKRYFSTGNSKKPELNP